MRRFFLGDIPVSEGVITVTGDLFRHMARVLRLKEGAGAVLIDGAGREYSGTITVVGNKSLVVAIGEVTSPPPENGPRITLYQGLPKGEKLDFILQKATELGVAEIIPFVAARSMAKVTERSARHLERWQRIVLEAARQSGRSSVPQVSLAENLADAMQNASQSAKFMLWEDEKDTRLKQLLAGSSPPETIAVLVGPEGGFTADEAVLARDNGFIPLSLGKRIMRTETAGLAMLAILQFYWGDIG
jgi:16S rRNA (uracil1498-N3)-methyltransferase